MATEQEVINLHKQYWFIIVCLEHVIPLLKAETSHRADNTMCLSLHLETVDLTLVFSFPPNKCVSSK